MTVFAVRVLGCQMQPGAPVSLDFLMPADDWLEARAKVAWALFLEGVAHEGLTKTPTEAR